MKPDLEDIKAVQAIIDKIANLPDEVDNIPLSPIKRNTSVSGTAFLTNLKMLLKLSQ